MNVYEFEWPISGEKDWIAANTKKQALEWYSDEIGKHIDEMPNPKRLSKEDAKSHTVIDYNDYYFDKEDDDEYIGGYKIEGNMYDLAQKATTPKYLATSNY